MDSERFSGRNQSIGCALASVTIARDSESDYPFKSCEVIPQDLCRTLMCQIGSTLTKFSLGFSSGCYCTSSIVGSRVYGNPLATLCTHYPIVWTVKGSVVGTRVLAVL